jgi:hypothetical protein
MKKHKPAETAKNILILVLLVSAIFLGWQSQLFGKYVGEAERSG